MFDNESVSVLMALLSLVFPAFLLYKGATFFGRWQKERGYRPIVCICEVNGRIGVVLRADYDRASREH